MFNNFFMNVILLADTMNFFGLYEVLLTFEQDYSNCAPNVKAKYTNI